MFFFVFVDDTADPVYVCDEVTNVTYLRRAVIADDVKFKSFVSV